MRTRGSAVIAMGFAWACFASPATAQLSHPYFEIVGGVVDPEAAVPSGNFIPPGALGASSVYVGSVAQPVTVILRDPGFTGAPRQVCVDYIGTDAVFENRFYVPGTAIDWCNKSTCTTPSATPVGAGGQSWTGPFAASACFQMNVGQPVPFVFVADVTNQGGNGSHTVGNGQANPDAHWAAFPYSFVFSPPMPTTSPVIGVGLADGAFDPLVDDDHQDFVVRFTAQPASAPQAAIPTLGQWGLLLLVLAVATLGLKGARRPRG